MSSHYNQDINGWIILDKPQAISSNQALRQIQYLLGAKKAGHIGTLDPFASGVLPLAFGEATKLIPYLENQSKTYEFALKFGISTTTDDTEGNIENTSSHIPDLYEIQAILPLFRGEITQIPPKYSAIHIDGKRAYERVRLGEEFSMPARQVTISELTLTDYKYEQQTAYFSVTCSKGTYIRTLGADIAKKLATVGHLTALRRTKSGFFDISDTILLENLKKMFYKERQADFILPVETFLCDITVIAIAEEDARKLKSGLAVKLSGLTPFEGIRATTLNNKLIALVTYQDNHLVPTRVFNL